ncbi:MAG: bifunctional 4-hydroxy-3-methylbut-2-enyl diphosphate reductase/30S ribosomal protein S1 [Clostridia bacterium]|nr:bifunctional 4-hydroxy-3-methylbut-2-enyl diphosphate reductase/30S ribosomal protein S1 [Clostridia bacterium]
MEIEVAKYAGFCFGVERAVSKTEELIAENKDTGVKIFTLGHLIHNGSVISRLERNGVFAIDIDKVESAIKEYVKVKLVIRAHGIPKDDYDFLCELKDRYPDFSVVDCTCPYVEKIHDIAKCESKKPDRFGIIIGDKDHPEVMGTKSCFSCPVYIFAKAEELERAISGFDPAFSPIMVAQTTHNLKEYKKCQKIIKKHYTNATIFDTICRVTENRQIEVEEFSARMDKMLIIGAKESSNSQKLYEISKMNCAESYFIESADDLDLSLFSPQMKVGIAAGASTPSDIIEEVRLKMSEIMEENFAQMLEESFKTLNTGDIVKGIITSITPTEIHVDLGVKATGILSRNDFSDDPTVDFDSMYKVGDEIEAIAVRVNDVEGIATLSKKRIDASKNWEKLVAAEQNGDVLDAKVIEAVKGGVVAVALASRVFIPGSQTEIAKDGDLSTLVGKTLKVKIISINEQRKRAVASQKVILREIRAENEAKFWEKAEVGQKFENATVKSLTNYGAFVDIGGIDGLLHSSELSWRHIKHPSEVVSVGDQITVFIKALDPEKKRISLGYKTEESNPWTIFTNKYSVGDTASVKIMNIMPFGAFAEIVPGVDGLIHISQIAKERIANPGDVLKKGDTVDAKIIDIDNEKNKVSLSIKALLVPEETAEAVEETIEAEEKTSEETKTDAE